MDTFVGPLHHKRNRVTCSISSDRLIVSREPVSASIFFKHIFAVHLSKTDPLSFTIYSCLFPNDPNLICNLKPKRRMKKFAHEFEAEDEATCREWVIRLQKKVFGYSILEQEEKAHKRNVLVILNPFSGKKLGKSYFKKFVKPIFDIAHLNYTIKLTERSAHCTEICENIDWHQYNEIVCCGGDGILYEAVNGLLKRRDWQFTSKIPLGIIPMGTSNGLAASCVGITSEEAAFHIARGFMKGFDIFSYTGLESNSKAFGFLSLTWGAIADADLGTENIRCLGSLRNQVGGIKSIVKFKGYKGIVRYLEDLPHDSPTERNNPIQSVYSYDISAEGKDDQIHSECPPCKLLEQYFSSYSSRFGSSITNTETVTSDSSQGSSVKELHDDFITICATNVSRIAHDVNIAPQQQLDSGELHFVYASRNGLTRGKLLSIFTGMENGTHFKHPEIKCIKTRAFELVPIDTDSFISLDGEKQVYESCFCEVHPSLCKLFVGFNQ